MIKITKSANGELIDVSIDGTSIEVHDCSEDWIFAECDTDLLSKIPAKGFPDGLQLRIHDSTGFGTYLFHELECFRKDGNLWFEFVCHHPNKYWEGKWGLATLLGSIRNQIKYHEGYQVGDVELEDDWKRLTILTVADSDDLEKSLALHVKSIRGIQKEAEIALSGMQWGQEYETDESLFCNEFLTPLLLRMGFLQLRYTHGKKEYGKDFTFSEMTPFGDLRHYGLQAKAGNVSGGVNAAIEEIIGQINDAFSMPYLELGSKDDRYISTFIVAISGRFTENAREKIVNKIPKGLTGSVYFLDRERLLELVQRFWKAQ